MRHLSAGLLLLSAVSTVLAQSPPEARFEVASVKENTSGDLAIRFEPTPPDGYRRDVPLESHLRYAFEIAQLSRIVNLPEWALATRYEIAGKATGPITGSATKFAFQFPHVFFEMSVGEAAAATTWTITTRWTPTILREHGWSRESIKPGDRVTVTYLPHVDKAHVGQMVTIEVNGAALPLSF